MAEPFSRLYDLALRTLDDQERRADALRSRLSPVLAAAALGVTLLSGPVVGGTPPTSVAGKLALMVALSGLLLTLAATFRLLSSRHSCDGELAPDKLAIELEREAALGDEQTFYSAMIVRLSDRVTLNADAIARLTRTVTAMLWGILVMLCGLALAALVG